MRYQTLGLLAPPSLVGRVGYYSEEHLGRLRLIAHLQEHGFNLVGIRRLVQAWEQGRSLGDLLGAEQTLTGPGLWRSRIPSPTMLRLSAQLVAANIPLAAIQNEFAALRVDIEQIAARFVDLFERYVWWPFVEGMPHKRLSQVTKVLGGIRPLAAMLVQVMLAKAMEHPSAASIAGMF